MLQTMKTRKWLAAVCGALALSTSLAACGGSSDNSSDGGTKSETLRIGYVGAAPPSFDPHLGSTGSFQAIFPAYDTLLHVDANGELQPWLAEEWTFTDPTTLELKLRDDVKFTDGSAFDADAVKANIEYARDAEQGTGFQAYLKGITEVKVVDATTVELVLAAPNPGLPFDFSQNPGQMVSPKALATPEGLAKAPAGTGPYVVDDAATRAGTTLAWKRNADYWAADQDVFAFDKVVYTFGQDPSAIRNSAAAGDLDTLSLFPGDEVPSGFKSVESNSGPNAGFTGIWLDVSGNAAPALKDVRVRQALNYAIDSATIADTVYNGAATPVPAVPIPDDSLAYTDALADKYPFDPDKAKQLLADAGYADGFKVKFLALPVAEAFAQAIAGNLRDVGIDAEINSVAGPDLPGELFSGTYGVGLILQRPTGQPGQDIEGLFTANSFFNVAKADDPKMDSMLAAAASAPDDAAQETAYQELVSYAADQAWFAGTLLVKNITAVKSDVVGVTPPPFGEIWLYNYTAGG